MRTLEVLRTNMRAFVIAQLGFGRKKGTQENKERARESGIFMQ